MYWRQIFISILLAGGASYLIYDLQGNLFDSAAVGIIVYIGLRLVTATYFKTRYWLRNGGHRSRSRSCPSCRGYIRRQSGDWILHCKRCGWTAGFPLLRWLTHSVPSIQFRRSLGWQRVIVLLLSFVIIVSAPTLGFDDLESDSDGPTDGGSDSNGPTDGGSDSNGPTDGGSDQNGPTDSDGDGLLNELETSQETNGGYPLPDADQNHKDLYARVYVGSDIQPLTNEERADLREIWANMPISNPDGKNGVNLHITQVQLSSSISTGLDTQSFQEQQEQIYERRVPEAAQCSVYAVVLVNVQGDTTLSGRGSAPGFVSIVDGGQTENYETKYTVRTRTITHELLHNIVGKFEDGSVHTDEGWLKKTPEVHGSQSYLSDKTASRLSENGFSESEYFEQEVCG